ncbi:hypothetical protein LJK88_17375 [Paenibacillus sp. P26]|nr:hypothetical protein LJK88_17375 [Paenibacillus sp. P26]UUZ96459.1 hypothetical protein LJK87_20430 [Paenibacillus sp. P25]
MGAGQGYSGIRVPADALIEAGEAHSLLEQAERELRGGRSVILYTALGPADESIGRTQSRLKQDGQNAADGGRLIGSRLGAMARELILSAGVRRLVIAGGDTSGFAVRELAIDALEMVSSVAPGGPLCRANSKDARLDGLEIVLKGGQVGPPEFFELVRRGKASAPGRELERSGEPGESA